MADEQFQRVEQLFHDAMELPAGEREAFLHAECGDDRETAARLERMLRFHQEPGATAAMNRGLADAFGDMPESWRDNGEDDLIGCAIGHYTIESKLGTGGFGDVYLAEQHEPVRRRVALKMIRASLGAARVLARFEVERQALAVMDHPNIASIFDAGTTDAELGARPYVVMEYVEGQAITAFCDVRRLNVRERIELFLQVCHGVQHAHQKGVIHRDLKPSNVVVAEHDERPLPKIIDFGIAKAIDEPLSDRAPVTEIRQMVGTPQYMSPEQAGGGGVVDTRTDIYSLGAMLYELLTGTPPIDAERVKTASFAELQQMLRERDPARPSTRFSTRTSELDEVAACRSSVTSLLRRMLRGELDWIVMKALEHDPARRYATASEFAADLGRFLAHEPVLAGPPSHVYRVRKFVRRNRVAVAAGVLVSLALVVGIVGLTIGLLQANQSAREAMAISNFLYDVLRAADPDRGGADMRVIDLLDDASDAIPIRFADQPMQQAKVRTFLSDAYSGLDLPEKSLAELRAAEALYRQHGGSMHPDLLDTERLIANHLLRLSRFTAAGEVLEGLIERDIAHFGPESGQTMQTQRMQALLLSFQGDFQGAKDALRDIIRRSDKSLGEADRRWLAPRRTLLRVMRTNLGGLVGAERQAAAKEGYELSAEMLEVEFDDADRPTQDQLDNETIMARFAFEALMFDEAIAISQEVLDETAGRFSDCDPLISMSLGTMARSYFGLRDYTEAARYAQRFIECAPPQAEQFNAIRLSALSDVLLFYDPGGMFAEGEQHARELTESFAAMGGHGEGMTLSYRIFLARFISRQGRFEEADGHFSALMARKQEIDPTRWAQLHLYYGRHLADQGEYEEAEREMTIAAELAGGAENGSFAQDRDDIIRDFIALYDAWGRPDDAARYRTMFAENGPAASR